MRDIYQRLKQLGFSEKYVREALLPDWWEDKLAKTPANRAIAEAAIAQHLSLPVQDLHAPTKELSLPSQNCPKFKHRRGTSTESLRLATFIGQRAASLLLPALERLPKFSGPRPWREVRESILSQRPIVDLAGLLSYSWSAGIPVIHIRGFPPGSKSFDGMALFIHDRPVIVLGSGRDGPPWLAFHLAHELGHVMLGHISEEGQILTDVDLNSVDDDEEERTANDYGLSLLKGDRTLVDSALPRKSRTTGSKLALAAHSASGRFSGLDPGAFALSFGFTYSERWGVANRALNELGLNKGARKSVEESLGEYLQPEELSESAVQFLERVASIRIPVL